MREKIYTGLASASFVLALAFLSLDGNFASSREHYNFWGNGWAYAMYVAFGFAVVFAVLTLIAWKQDHMDGKPQSPPSRSQELSTVRVPTALTLASDAARRTSDARVHNALAKAAAGGGGKADSLIQRGETLLAKAKTLRQPVDPHIAKYQPVVSAAHGMELATRYFMGSPPLVGAWLADVSRFVAEDAPEYSDRIYPEPVRSLRAEQTAIEQNLAVLREIARGRIQGLLDEGVALLNNDRVGADPLLLDRAAEKWIDKVRIFTEADDPIFASHFTIQEAPGRDRHEGQFRRMHELVQRLSFFVRGDKEA